MVRAPLRAHVLLLLVLAAALATPGSEGAGYPSVHTTSVSATANSAVTSRPSSTGAGGSKSETRREGAASELTTRSVTVPSGSTAYWLVHDSPTTQVHGDGLARSQRRIVRWGPGGLYASTRRTYALFGFRVVTGSPGRMYDFHTQPGDVGGWFPACSNGVAPLAIDYRGDSRGLTIAAEPEDSGCSGGRGKYHFGILSQTEMEARRGQWIWLWAEITWGRREFATKGALKVWVAGEDAPRVNVSGINTHYRDQNQITFWEGIYHGKGSRGTSAVEIAATRFGRTPEEAYADVPALYRAEPAGTPGGSSAVVAPRHSTEAVFLRAVPGRARVQTDRRCRIVSSTRGRIVARIAAARDDRDTAVVTYRVKQRDAAVIGYRLQVVARRLTGTLVVTQLRRSNGRVLAELYVGSGGTLRLSSPAGALRRRGYDVDTGIAATEARKVELRLGRSSLLFGVDGRVIVRLSNLRGPPSGTGLRARIGIDRYEGRAGDGPIRAVYDELVVGSS